MNLNETLLLGVGLALFTVAGVRLRAGAAAAGLVGPLAWNSTSSRTWRPASARRCRWKNLGFALIGCLLGTLIGVLPGIGPIPTIAMLLPITFGLDPLPSLIMLAGIYYGAQYGGSTTSILVNMPGEASSIVTCIDGHQMAKQGRAGAALGGRRARLVLRRLRRHGVHRRLRPAARRASRRSSTRPTISR